MNLSCSTRVGAWMLTAVLGFASYGRAEDGPRTFADLKREHERADSAMQQRREQARTDAEWK